MLKIESQTWCCFAYICLEVGVAVQKIEQKPDPSHECPNAVGTARLLLDSPWRWLEVLPSQFNEAGDGGGNGKENKIFHMLWFFSSWNNIFLFSSPGFKLQLLLLQLQLIFHLSKRKKKNLSSLWIPRETFHSNLQLVVASGKWSKIEMLFLESW